MLIYYLEKLLKINSRVKGLASTSTTEKGSYVIKKYEQLLIPETLYFYSTSVRALDILKCFHLSKLPYPDFNRLVQLNKPQMRSLMLSQGKKPFYGDTVVINWVPYKNSV